MTRQSRQVASGRAIVAVVAVGLSLAACGENATRPPEAGDVAVAEAGGRTIWRSDVRREAVAQSLIPQGQALAPDSPLFRRVLDEVVDQRLLAAEAERRGLGRGDEGRRRVAAAQDRALGDLLIEQSLVRAVDDNAVQALYREQVRMASRAEQLRVRQIVSASQADAMAIRRLLDAGGAFDRLATERSADAGTRFNGGDLGWFNPATMPPEYAAALTGAQTGQTVGPFAAAARPGQGPAAPTWVLLRVEDRRPQPPPTLEDARPQIRRFLTFDQISELIQTLRRGARVRYLVRVAPQSGEAVAPGAGAVPRPSEGTAAPGTSPGTAAPTAPTAEPRP